MIVRRPEPKPQEKIEIDLALTIQRPEQIDAWYTTCLDDLMIEAKNNFNDVGKDVFYRIREPHYIVCVEALQREAKKLYGLLHARDSTCPQSPSVSIYEMQPEDIIKSWL